jgi:hypothetical protein
LRTGRHSRWCSRVCGDCEIGLRMNRWRQECRVQRSAHHDSRKEQTHPLQSHSCSSTYPASEHSPWMHETSLKFCKGFGMILALARDHFAENSGYRRIAFEPCIAAQNHSTGRRLTRIHAVYAKTISIFRQNHITASQFRRSRWLHHHIISIRQIRTHAFPAHTKLHRMSTAQQCRANFFE